MRLNLNWPSTTSMAFFLAFGVSLWLSVEREIMLRFAEVSLLMFLGLGPARWAVQPLQTWVRNVARDQSDRGDRQCIEFGGWVLNLPTVILLALGALRAWLLVQDLRSAVP